MPAHKRSTLACVPFSCSLPITYPIKIGRAKIGTYSLNASDQILAHCSPDLLALHEVRLLSFV